MVNYLASWGPVSLSRRTLLYGVSDKNALVQLGLAQSGRDGERNSSTIISSLAKSGVNWVKYSVSDIRMTATPFYLNHLTLLSAREDVIEFRRRWEPQEIQSSGSQLVTNFAERRLRQIHMPEIPLLFFFFFQSPFAHLRRAPNSFVMSFCLTARPSIRIFSAGLPLNGLLWDLIFETSIKICLERRNLVKIRQKCWTLCVKT